MMKSLKLMALLGVIALGGLSASAADTESMRIHVPFSFVVGTQGFPAGDYLIEKDSYGVVTIQGRGQAAMVISTPSTGNDPSAVACLRFVTDQTGEHLVKVAMLGEPERAIPVHAYQQRQLALGAK